MVSIDPQIFQCRIASQFRLHELAGDSVVGSVKLRSRKEAKPFLHYHLCSFQKDSARMRFGISLITLIDFQYAV